MDEEGGHVLCGVGGGGVLDEDAEGVAARGERRRVKGQEEDLLAGAVRRGLAEHFDFPLAQGPTLPSYTLNVTIDYDGAIVQADQVTRLRNQTGLTLDRAVFQVSPIKASTTSLKSGYVLLRE